MRFFDVNSANTRQRIIIDQFRLVMMDPDDICFEKFGVYFYWRCPFLRLHIRRYLELGFVDHNMPLINIK